MTYSVLQHLSKQNPESLSGAVDEQNKRVLCGKVCHTLTLTSEDEISSGTATLFAFALSGKENNTIITASVAIIDFFNAFIK